MQEILIRVSYSARTLVVLTAGTGSAAGWSAEQNDLATLSSHSVHRTGAPYNDVLAAFLERAN